MQHLDMQRITANFLEREQLPKRFLQTVERWYLPLADKLARRRTTPEQPLVTAITGSQGSGKSTLAAILPILLKQVHGLKATALSLDDFYLTRAERRQLATDIHPLLATRGVPGTHDTALLRATLERLTRRQGRVPVPQFDKARDDRRPEEEWDRVPAPQDIVILEGWCLGVPPQDEEALLQPVNRLESEEDREGIWRRYVNRQLAGPYQDNWNMIDAWIMLQAPSFDCVYRWRLEQEEKLAARQCSQPAPEAETHIMSAQALERFVQHYQRLTEHALRRMPDRVDYLYSLNADREITAFTEARTRI